MTEDPATLTRTFTLGQAFCVLTGIPLMGERTFELTRELVVFITGSEPPFETIPDIDDVTFLDYLIWTAAVKEVAGPLLFQFMVAQHPATNKLRTLPDFLANLNDDASQMVEDFMVKSKADGIHFEESIELMPLPYGIQAELHDRMSHRTLRETCHRLLLVEKSRAMAGTLVPA